MKRSDVKQKLVEYIKGELNSLHPNTKNAMIKRGWLTEEGKVTDAGLDASELPVTTSMWLELGSNVQLGRYLLPKGLLLPLTWRFQEGNDRRKWYYIVSFPVNEGKDAVELTLMFNPKHVVKLVKLPIDTINKIVLQ